MARLGLSEAVRKNLLRASATKFRQVGRERGMGRWVFIAAVYAYGKIEMS